MVVFGGDYMLSYPNYPNDAWALTLAGSPAWILLPQWRPAESKP
jgi:hypothetical protein